ncbi:MAG: PQQ-dependent sugar dehydrogenase [Pseudomonadota bacterium]
MRQAGWIKTGLMGLSLITLTACLEPQPAPDLPEQPQSDFQLDIIAEGLASPWAAAELPDGGFLVTGKFGQLWRVANGQVTEITGLPDEIVALADNRIATEGQGGFLDIALAPDFETSGTVYMSYSYGDWAANNTGLLRATLADDQLTNVETVFRALPAKEAGNHYGGKIAFPGDGTLLLALGDAFSMREEAQITSSHLGSVVRLTLDGEAARDNPDFGDGAMAELFTMGHRNVQGLTVDQDTGVIWAHEHGPRGGDELNLLEAGGNYGWPVATAGLDYQGARISPQEEHTGFNAPAHGWTPSIAPSGLAIYRGDVFPGWDGHALVGGLASGDLRKVDPATGEEVILLSDAKTDEDRFRVRDVDIASDGTVLLLIEDPENGRLIRMSSAPQ